MSVTIFGVTLDPLALGGVLVLAGIVGVIILQKALAWIKMLILRMALHHFGLAVLGALGVGLETLTEGGIMGAVTWLLDALGISLVVVGVI